MGKEENRKYYQRELISAFCIALTIHASAGAAHLYPEKEYQRAWCEDAGGQMEYVLDDQTRVDCLTAEYAVEFDFAPKWAEAVGQSLYYAMKTGRKPGIVLIMEKEGDDRHWKKIEFLMRKYAIKVWSMTSLHAATALHAE